jgi:DNA-directed RNA polymerase specialized sigma subunit
MTRSIKELENLINTSTLFSIDKLSNPEQYISNERNFLSNLAELMQKTRKDFSNIGLEIISTAKACLKAYNKENGLFLNYFNSALALKVRKEKIKQMRENRSGGIKFSTNHTDLIRKIMKLKKFHGIDNFSEDFIALLSQQLNISQQDIKDAIEKEINTIAISEIINDSDGEETNMFNYLSDNTDMELEFENKEKVLELFNKIDEIFANLQERQKPLLRQLLTLKFAPNLVELNVKLDKFLAYIFIDKDLLAIYMQNNIIETAKQIAEKFGTSEQNASRVLKNFLERIRSK